MKLPDLKIREAFFTLLNNTISSGGAPVPAFDTVPSGAAFPYIRFTEQTDIEASSKTGAAHDATMLIDIYTAFDGQYGGKKQSDEIASEVVGLMIAERHSLDLGADFNTVDIFLADARSLEEDDQQFHIIRKVLRFRLLITEK